MGGSQPVLIGAIEGGGTKFVCAVAASAAQILERVVIPTTTAQETFAQCVDFLHAAARRHGRLAALGIACFGPLQLRRDANDYGCLLPTPKPGWSGVNVLEPFRKGLGVPIALDTDVGAAARGELALGAGRARNSLVYVTVGTGIGGAVAPDHPGTHLMHAEMGHLVVRRDPRDVQFAGICPFHGDCLEGLASGPAIRARWGCDLSALPAEHPGPSIIAFYLGQLGAAIALLHSPQVLVMGGGVLSEPSLLGLVRQSTHTWLRGYLRPLLSQDSMEAFLQLPALAGDSAITGAILMALEARRFIGEQAT